MAISDREKLINNLVSKIMQYRAKGLTKAQTLDKVKALVKKQNKKWISSLNDLFEKTWKKRVKLEPKPEKVKPVKHQVKPEKIKSKLGIEDDFIPKARIKKLKPAKPEKLEPAKPKRVVVTTQPEKTKPYSFPTLNDKKIKIKEDKKVKKAKYTFGPDIPDEFEDEYGQYDKPLSPLTKKKYKCTNCGSDFVRDENYTNRLLCPTCFKKSRDFANQEQYETAKSSKI